MTQTSINYARVLYELSVTPESIKDAKRVLEERSLRRQKEPGVGTKSQQALAAQREAVKTERKVHRKEMREEREHSRAVGTAQRKRRKL